SLEMHPRRPLADREVAGKLPAQAARDARRAVQKPFHPCVAGNDLTARRPVLPLCCSRTRRDTGRQVPASVDRESLQSTPASKAALQNRYRVRASTSRICGWSPWNAWLPPSFVTRLGGGSRSN